MQTLEDTTTVIDPDDRLDVIVSEIKQSLKRTVHEIITVGNLLIEAKDILQHGDFTGWLTDNFISEGLSESSAGRFMRVARFASEHENAKLENLKPSTVYLLSAKSTPELAVDTVLGLLDAGQTPNRSEVAGIISDASTPFIQYAEAYEQRVKDGELSPLQAQKLSKKLITIHDPELRETVLNLKVSDAGVIDVLAKLKDKEPDEYEAVVSSKHFQGSGDPVPVSSANERDAKDIYKEIRWNASLANDPYSTVADCFATLFGVDEDPMDDRYAVVSFRVNAEDVQKLAELMQGTALSGFMRFRQKIQKIA